jgi:thiol-disulfide isomerase/thioredoxin
MKCLIHSLVALSAVGSWLSAVAGDDTGPSAEVSRPAEISQEVKPDWNDLPGVDGKTHSLKDIKTRFVAVVFLANHCALCRFQEEELNRIQEDYREKGLTLVAVSVSTRSEDQLPKMIERSKSAAYKFSYLHDSSQETGRRFRVTCTPTVFLLNEERKIVYRGALNDDGTPIMKHYLREALDEADRAGGDRHRAGRGGVSGPVRALRLVADAAARVRDGRGRADQMDRATGSEPHGAGGRAARGGDGQAGQEGQHAEEDAPSS